MGMSAFEMTRMSQLVMAGGMSTVFADCAGHTKAQLVKSDDPQISSDRQASNDASTAVQEKVVQQPKIAKATEKK